MKQLGYGCGYSRCGYRSCRSLPMVGGGLPSAPRRALSTTTFSFRGCHYVPSLSLPLSQDVELKCTLICGGRSVDLVSDRNLVHFFAFPFEKSLEDKQTQHDRL